MIVAVNPVSTDSRRYSCIKRTCLKKKLLYTSLCMCVHYFYSCTVWTTVSYAPSDCVIALSETTINRRPTIFYFNFLFYLRRGGPLSLAYRHDRRRYFAHPEPDDASRRPMEIERRPPTSSSRSSSIFDPYLPRT